jgi:SSS family solute:Na+ symporter
VIFAKATLFTTGFTTAVWLAVTLLTKPEPGETLVSFYRKVRPQITGWRPIAKLSGDETVTRDLPQNLLCWLAGCVLVYSMLFFIGEICFGRYREGFYLGIIAAAAAAAISLLMPKSVEWRQN